MEKNLKLNSWIKNLLVYLLATVVFLLFYGLEALNPQNINWLLSARHDWGQHYLGWAFYKDEPWTFPLGHINNYIYPIGSNVGFTDSIPLIAVFLKLFKAWIPEDFQYIGIWILSCYIMLAHYTYKICNLYKVNFLLSICITILILINPVLFYRGMHPALCSHWLLLGSVYYYLIPASADNVNKLNKKQFFLSCLSALINPYMFLMLIGFNIILPLKHYFYDRLISLSNVFFWLIKILASVTFLWLLIGMISLKGGEDISVDGGYGLYSLNINSLYNPFGLSSVVPQQPTLSWHQYEGFMYLGVGMITMLFISVFILCCKSRKALFFKEKKWLLPLLILVLLLILFAFTNKISFEDKIVFEIPINDRFIHVLNIFRASARTFWLAYYLVIIVSLLVFVKVKINYWIKATVLVTVILIQVYDLESLYKSRNIVAGGYDSPLNEKEWKSVLSPVNRIITYLPFNNSLLNTLDYQDLCYVALKNKKPITIGYSARENITEIKIITDSLTDNITSGNISINDLYVTTPKYIDDFKYLVATKKAILRYLDGYYLLYHPDKKITLSKETGVFRMKLDSLNEVFSQSSFIKEIVTPKFENNKIELNIEEIAIRNQSIKIGGWAFIKKSSTNKENHVFITISEGDKTYLTKTKFIQRPDLNKAFNKFDLENSGFNASFLLDREINNDTKLGIAIKNEANEWVYSDLGYLNHLNPNKKLKKISKLPKEVEMAGNIDNISNEVPGFIEIGGWAIIRNQDSDDNEISVVLSKGENKYSCSTAITLRPDVNKAFNNKFNYEKSGFSVKIDSHNLESGDYKIYLIVKNRKSRIEILMNTGRILNIR